MADEKNEHCNLKRKFVCMKMQIFIGHYVFRRQSPELFFSKKIPQMKADQNNKYDITITLGLVQVWAANKKKSQIVIDQSKNCLQFTGLSKESDSKVGTKNLSIIF